jgi:tetratricopeptide (TPR) repeat protein
VRQDVKGHERRTKRPALYPRLRDRLRLLRSSNRPGLGAVVVQGLEQQTLLQPRKLRLVRLRRTSWSSPILCAVSCLLLGFLLSAPVARAQRAALPSQPGEINGAVPKPSRASRAKSSGYTVSLHQLRIPGKALRAFRKGLERLAKLDAVGGRKQFAQAIAAFPDYYEAYYHEGVSELRLGHDDEAAQAFQKAIDLSEGRYAWAQFALGAVLSRRGQPTEGEAVIRRGLDVDGTSETGYLFLSTALFAQNRFAEAEQSAREALLRKPGLAPAYLVLADIHGRQGEYALQLHDLDDYLKLAPKGPSSKQIREVREVVQQMASRAKS